MKSQGGTASILSKREEKLQELGPAIEANEMKPSVENKKSRPNIKK